jgi:hypothetical protein
MNIILWLAERGAGRLALVFFLVSLAFAASCGWTANGWRWEARFTALQSAHEQALLAAQQAAVTALEKARAAEAVGEKLAQTQLALEAQNTKLEKEKENALRKITTGRACLSGGALRLLDAPPVPAGRVGLRPPPGGAFGAASAASADSGDIADGYAASDTDIALWAAHAKNEYERCRGRLDALSAFYLR